LPVSGGASRDVTKEVEATERLQRSVERYELAREHGNISVWENVIVDGEVRVSGGPLSVPEDSPSGEVAKAGEAWLLSTYLEDRPKAEALYRDLVENKPEHFELEHRVVRPDGSVGWIRTEGWTLGDDEDGNAHYIGVSSDISERKETEVLLIENETRLADVLRISGIGSWNMDLLAGESQWSEQTYSIYGYGERRFTPTFETSLSHFHLDDKEWVQKAFQDSLKVGAPPYSADFRIVQEGGAIRYVHAEGEATFDERGRAIRIQGTLHDITDRKLAEIKIRNSEERVRSIMENAAVAIVTIDELGLIESFNPMAQQIFGYRESEVLGLNVSILMPEPYHSDHDRYLERYRKTEIGHMLGVGPRELLGLRKDGSEFPMELAVAKMNIGDKRSFIGSVLDISGRKEIEEQLRSAQRLEAVGQLTGGIAHDFNNLLMALQLNIEFAQARVQDDPETLEFLDSSLHAVGRGADLTQRLLAFSRKQTLAPEPVDVGKQVSNMSKLLERTLGETIDVETVLGAGLWLAEVDASQFENVLLNLAINARDAMPEGGKLTIETVNTRLDQDYASHHLEIEPGQYVMVAVTDTGSGMPPDVLERAFEPFFTTKEVGQGSGLGLSMIFGFVKQSRGHIKIYSEEGEGTTLKMYFPRVGGTETEKAKEHRSLRLSKGNETILVVEDQPEVLRAVAISLESLGYTALEAEHGPAAITLVEQGARPDLVLSDVVLPQGMHGGKVVEAVRALLPGCKAIFMSGYTENSIVHQGRVDEGVELLQKPYTQEDLARKVRQVLDEQD
jgi:PAS domain S-box-containing protein